MAQVKFCANPK